MLSSRDPDRRARLEDRMSELTRPRSGIVTVPAPAAVAASAGAPSGGGKEEIFLSPRVIDRQAFAEFAGQLRSLIDDAARQGETLRAEGETAQRTRESLHDAVNANQMKLDMATRALATIDQKAEQTRRLIESASDITTRIDDFRAQADQVIQERTGILCQRLNEAEEASVAQVEALHRRLAEVERAAAEREGSLRAALDAVTARADRLEDLVARAEAQSAPDHGLRSLVDRADAAGRSAELALVDLERIGGQADEARQGLAQTLNAAVPIIDDASTVQGHLEQAVNNAMRLTETARASLQAEADTLAARLRAEADRAAPAITDAYTQLAQAMEAATTARHASQAATTNAQDAARRLASLLQEVTPWRRVLLGDSEDAPVGAALNGVIVELKKELRGVAGALRSLAERTEGAVD
jgi:chromosome segregation ATPase